MIVESSVSVVGDDVLAGAVTVSVISTDCVIVVSTATEDEDAEPEPEEPSTATTEYEARGWMKASLGWKGREDVRKGRDDSKSNCDGRSKRMLFERDNENSSSSGRVLKVKCRERW